MCINANFMLPFVRGVFKTDENVTRNRSPERSPAVRLQKFRRRPHTITIKSLRLQSSLYCRYKKSRSSPGLRRPYGSINSSVSAVVNETSRLSLSSRDVRPREIYSPPWSGQLSLRGYSREIRNQAAPRYIIGGWIPRR